MNRTILLMAVLGLPLVASCSSDSSGGGRGGAETGPERGADISGADANGEADAALRTCRFQTDCAAAEICVGDRCREAPTCDGPADWEECVSAIEGMEAGLGKRAYCGGDRCRVGCMLDRHCPDGDICTDFGSCRDFEGSLDAEPPGGESRDGLEAGVGETLVEFPIGVSLGGYGSRMQSDDGRYVETLRSTHGQMEGLYARALALDNGARKLLMVRLPIIFSTSALHEAVARRLQSEVGGNWRGSLLISATHTHSGPARYYQLPQETLLPLGRLGIGTFHDRAFQWLVDSTVSAAERALANLEPARLGTEIVEGFDTDDAIAGDRRSETPRFDDNRLLVLRIDDESGTPRAVAISFGVHGTIHSGDYFTTDAPGAVEHGLERALAQKYDRRVPVLFFNQNGGSMSPGGSRKGHDQTQRFEKLGVTFSTRAADRIERIETEPSVPLDGATYRFPITYDLIGYQKGEFANSRLELDEGSLYHGGFQCTGGGDTNFETAQEPDELRCLAVSRLLHHRPPTLFLRSQMSAFRIGETTFVTLPGELTMEFSWNVLHRLREEHGLDPARTWTLGFAQDHQFYLNPTRMPDADVPFEGFVGTQPTEASEGAFSYFQGGYEANMSFWGWKFGDYLADRASDTVERLLAEEVRRELPEVLPTQYSAYGSEEFPVEQSDPEKVGDPIRQPPETVERFEVVEYAWVGGDPGAERPQAPRVALQRRTEQGFETVETDALRPYTNREPVMLTRLRRSGDSWVWVVRWEENRDFPTGTYRFTVEGSYRSETGIESYETSSRPFEMTVSDELAADLDGGAGTIEGTIGYPPGEELEFVEESDDPGAVEGTFRLRDRRVPTGVPAPLEVGSELSPSSIEITFEEDGAIVETLTGSELTLQSVDRNRGGVSGVPTTTVSAPVPESLSEGTTYRVSVRAVDTYGNVARSSFNHQPGN